MKTKINKLFPEYPFAHRQPAHDGHCALIHGHNWSFDITFEARTLEEGTGFVVDFGKLKTLKAWLADRFDHTLVLNETDPLLGHLQYQLNTHRNVSKIVPVPDCSCEGLARYLLDEINSVFFLPGGAHSEPDWIRRQVRVSAVKVLEDSKNSATAEY